MHPGLFSFVLAGQRKVIEHYRRLIDTSQSAEERALLERRLVAHERDYETFRAGNGTVRRAA